MLSNMQYSRSANVPTDPVDMHGISRIVEPHGGLISSRLDIIRSMRYFQAEGVWGLEWTCRAFLEKHGKIKV